MTQLAIAVVVIEVVGKRYVCGDTIATYRTRPTIVERGNRATSFTFRLWETNSRTSHGNAGSYGDAALLVVVHGAIEVINHTIVLHDVALMGKHLVVGL